MKFPFFCMLLYICTAAATLAVAQQYFTDPYGNVYAKDYYGNAYYIQPPTTAYSYQQKIPQNDYSGPNSLVGALIEQARRDEEFWNSEYGKQLKKHNEEYEKKAIYGPVFIPNNPHTPRLRGGHWGNSFKYK